MGSSGTINAARQPQNKNRRIEMALNDQPNCSDSGRFDSCNLETDRLNYENLRSKYLQQRELSDLLLEPLLGTADWRQRLTVPQIEGPYQIAAPVRFTSLLPYLDLKLVDYMWNNIDQTQYLHWSVYHLYWDWLTPPDANGHGGLNVGFQKVPALGGTLDAVFATWDAPSRYVDFPIEAAGSLLIRFWHFNPQEGRLEPRCFGPASAFLLMWDPAPGGGVVMRSVPCTHAPEHPFTPEMLSDADMGAMMPHEMEEARSWTMAIIDLVRRRRVDLGRYQPVWSREAQKAGAPAPYDRNLFQVWSSAEIDAMDGSALRAAYDALWQKYLGVKMLSDFLLHRGLSDLSDLPPATREVYNNYFVPKVERDC
jgi:hypothetical protein